MTTILPQFELVRPSEVAAAVAEHRAHAGSRFIAGGTDLLLGLRQVRERPDRLIDLSGIEELRRLDVTEDGTVIGAAVKIATLANHAEMSARYRAVVQAAAELAGPGHRSLATVGGNLCLDTRCIYLNQSDWWRRANGPCLKVGGDICHVAPQGTRCHAAFSGDLAPALLALEAEAEIAGSGGRRRIPLNAMYRDDGKDHLVLDDDEIVVAVHLTAEAPSSAYAKVRTRGAVDFPLAGVAVALAVTDDLIRELRIAITGTNTHPFVVEGTDEFVGHAVDENAVAKIERLVQKQVQPMRTTIAASFYRRLVAGSLAGRLVQDLYSELVT